MDIDSELAIDFKDNSPFQEDVISEMYQRPDKSYFQEPQELESLINRDRLIKKFLPKQADIDKILKIIQRNVLKEMHLPVTIKEIQAGYLISSYLYLAQNKLPNTKTAFQKVEILAERYILLDSPLFKKITTAEKDTALLAILEVCTDKITMLYHSNLFAGHQGVTNTYLIISDTFFIPGLIHYLCSHSKGYHICQLSRNEEPPIRQLQTRINLNHTPLSRLSMDYKVMPRFNKGHKYTLCITGEVTNYLITVPIHQSKPEEIGDALIENIITKCCVPDYVITDQDSTFMSSLMNNLIKKLDIKIKTVAPYNHQSLQAEHGINHCQQF